MKPTIYIDGQAGTTGLQIYQRLGDREDITLLSIDPSKRKDAAERKKLLNAADLVFLCLPDAAAITLLQQVFQQAAEYPGPMPGASAAQCGNYRNLSLAEGCAVCAWYAGVIRDWTPARLAYPQRA